MQLIVAMSYSNLSEHSMSLTIHEWEPVVDVASESERRHAFVIGRYLDWRGIPDTPVTRKNAEESFSHGFAAYQTRLLK